MGQYHNFMTILGDLWPKKGPFLGTIVKYGLC